MCKIKHHRMDDPGDFQSLNVEADGIASRTAVFLEHPLKPCNMESKFDPIRCTSISQLTPLLILVLKTSSNLKIEIVFVHSVTISQYCRTLYARAGR